MIDSRKRFYTRILSILVCTFMIVSLLSACGSKDEGKDTTEKSEGTTVNNEGSESKDKDVKLEPITFTAAFGDMEWGEDPISRKITEKTGVSLDMEPLVGDAQEKLAVMLAGGDYPELLLSINFNTLHQYASADALVPMDEYVDKYGENIKKIFGDNIGRMRTDFDGKIYGFNMEYNKMDAQPMSYFWVQYDVLKEAGYPVIKTLDELYTVLKQYKDKHPKINGQDTIVLTAWADSWGFNITFNNPVLKVNGWQNDGNFHVINEAELMKEWRNGEDITDKLKVDYVITTPGAKKYFGWLNKLNREGLFDQEALIQKREAFHEKLASGRVLCATTDHFDVRDVFNTIRQQGMDNRQYAPMPVMITESMESNIANYDPAGSWPTVITDKCKDPERAFKFIDQMWSEEMQVLAKWGIEGEHYTVDSNGKRHMKPEILEMKKTDPDWEVKTGLYQYTWCCQGDNVKDSTGNYIDAFDNEEAIAETYDDYTKEFIKNYNIDNWKELEPEPKQSPWGFIWKLSLPNDSEGGIAQSKCDDELRRKAIPKVILAKSNEEFKKEWEKFVDSVEDAGIALREEEILKALKKRMNLWYK